MNELTLYIVSTEASVYRRDLGRLLCVPTATFPGSQPVSFNRRHLFDLFLNDFVVYEKSDGIRSLLYITRDKSTGLSKQILINRKAEMLDCQSCCRLPTKTDRTIHDLCSWEDGTVLDGEIVRQVQDGHERLVFLVFDCLALGGSRMMDLAHRDRYKTIRQAAFWDNDGNPDHDDCIQTILKHPVPSYRLKDLVEGSIPKLAHDNDGLIFVRSDSMYSSGTSECMLKWKAPEDITVDFSIKVCDPPDQSHMTYSMDASLLSPTLTLLAYCGKGQYQAFANMQWSRDIGPLAHRLRNHETVIAECCRDAKGSWQFKTNDDGSPKFRTDKLHGNHIKVISEIVQSINDHVTLSELISQLPRMKSAWRNRRVFA